MPRRALHQCNHQGCYVLTSERYCAVHARQAQQAYEQTRETAAERGYDGNWIKVREIKLRRHPLCERCAPRVVPAEIVHHKDRNPRNNRIENLESLCLACHEAEHRRERWGGWIKSSRPSES